jgi:hypothetical protein
MSEQWPDHDQRWESRVRDAARDFPYPPTPDIAGSVRVRLDRQPISPYRRLALAAAVMVVVVLGGLLAVPEVRAAILEALRIGGITIFVGATPTPAPEATTIGTVRTPRPTMTPYVEPTPVVSVLDLPGETTLAEARSRANFDILIPTYPDDLGDPDHVFLQDLGGPVVTMVWVDDRGSARLTLQVLDERVVGSKYEPGSSRVTTVNGDPAVWLTGAHMLAFYEPAGRDFIRLIDSNVLIWEQAGITYRLETDEPLEEAVRIAESLE